MMDKELGTVVKVEGGRAEVVMERSAACEGCGASHQCLMFSDGKMKLAVPDTLGVKKGDCVELELGRGSALLKASFLAYMVPLASLFVGAILGMNISRYAGWALSKDLAGVLFGMGFLVLAFLVVRRLNARFERSSDFQVRMVRVSGRPSAYVDSGDGEV